MENKMRRVRHEVEISSTENIQRRLCSVTSAGHTHTHAHTNAHTLRHTHTHKHTHTQKSTYRPTHGPIPLVGPNHVLTAYGAKISGAHTHRPTHTRTHTSTHTHTHTHTQADTSTHIDPLAWFDPIISSRPHCTIK